MQTHNPNNFKNMQIDTEIDTEITGFGTSNKLGKLQI